MNTNDLAFLYQASNILSSACDYKLREKDLQLFSQLNYLREQIDEIILKTECQKAFLELNNPSTPD